MVFFPRIMHCRERIPVKTGIRLKLAPQVMDGLNLGSKE